MRRMLLWMLAVGLPAVVCAEPPLQRFQFTQTEMAIPVKVVFYAPDNGNANSAAKAVFDRFHELNHVLSDYDPDSELSRLCLTAGSGKAVRLSPELWTVLNYAQRIATRSEGAFDVTVGPVVHLWRRARRRKDLPPPEKLEAAKQLVGRHLLVLDPERHTAELRKPGMLIDLGGIAKGYAVDEGLAVLRRHGITRAMIHAGGDIGLGDPPPGKTGWSVGVGLLEPLGPPTQMLTVCRCSVSTSGDMWQFVVIDGKRYSHIVDPRTGIGLTDHCSVTIVGPNGISTDPLGKVVAILGPEKGLKLVDQAPGMAALITRAPKDIVETFQSSRWQDLRAVEIKSPRSPSVPTP